MKPKLAHCILCNSGLSGPVLDLGELPPCNRFVLRPGASPSLYPLMLTECSNCSLIQLLGPPPAETFIPQVPWVRYNEPDAHLDAVSAELLPYLKTQAPVYGVGPFDQPLLKKFQEKNFPCETLDLLAAEAKNQKDSYPYLETLQARLQPALLQSLFKSKERAELLVCRYLLEHCRNPLAALDSFRSLLTENGLVLIEVPDSSKFLNRKDYSFIWEEHVCYFTEMTLGRLFDQAGYQLVKLLRFEGQLEDALVALAQPLPQGNRPARPIEHKSASLFAPYMAAFAGIRTAYQKQLAAICERGGKVAVFGAGHQAILFINALGLQDYISYFVDDDVNKQAYLSPGAHLPIVSSNKMLSDDKIDTCLLAVSPRIEGKILEKCRALLERGGKMISIFPGSNLYPFKGAEEEAQCSL